MSNLENSINEKLAMIENNLVKVLDLVDYKKLCEEQLGCSLNQDNINDFISNYTKFLKGLHKVNSEKEDAFVNGALVAFMTFFLAIAITLYTQSALSFVGVIIFGFIIYLIMRIKNNKKCEKIKSQLRSDWKEYKSTLPFNSKVISIMEDIVYDYYGDFKYPSDFYKELYLRLKNNSAIK